MAAENLAVKRKAEDFIESQSMETNSPTHNNKNQNLAHPNKNETKRFSLAKQEYSKKHNYNKNNKYRNAEFNGKRREKNKAEHKSISTPKFSVLGNAVFDETVHKRRHHNCDENSIHVPESKTVKFCKSLPTRTATKMDSLPTTVTAGKAQADVNFVPFPATAEILSAPSLVDICTKVLQNNIDGMEYTGGVSFEYLQSILELATPSQLYAFEQHNLYLMADSDILWQQHVAIKYPNKKRHENESWRDMFMRCQVEKEQSRRAAAIRKAPLAYFALLAKAYSLRKLY